MTRQHAYTKSSELPEYLERWTSEWFVLWVMRDEQWSWDWVALLVDEEPGEFQSSWNPLARTRLFRIPGKHRNRASAWPVLADLMQTRH